VYWLGYVVIYVATTRFNVFPVMSGTSTSGAWMFLVPVVVLGLNHMYTAVVDHGAHAMHHTADHVVLFDCVERFHSEA
jgi:ABC-type dipeptide/oligopeptide/nickel transport system permease component